MSNARGVSDRNHDTETVSTPSWWRWFLVGLFAVAALWRIGALIRLGQTPLLTLLSADSACYWNWASEIRSGHVLPVEPFFLGPLYPYWLALLRTLLGDGLPLILAFQSLLGSAAVVLIVDACRRLATPRVAALIGIALAGYGMAVFFDLQLLTESLLFLLGGLALWLMIRDGNRAPVLVGSILGVMSLGRPTHLLLLIPYGLYLVGTRGARRVGAITGLLVIPFVVVVTTGLYHLRVAGAWMPLTYSGGFNLYIGNGPLANGTSVPFVNTFDDELPHASPVGGGAGDGRSYILKTEGLHLSAAASAQYWRDQALAHVQAHPARAAELFVLKLALLFNRRELPQITDANSYNRAAGPLGWPLAWEFALFGVGGLLGLPIAWARGRESRLVAGCLFALVIGAAIFFAVDRYRIHLLPPLSVLAAIGIAGLAEWARARDAARLARAGVVVAGASLLVFLPLIPASRARADWDYAATMGEAWLARGEPQRALEWLERAAAIDRSGALPNANEPSARVSRASQYEELGVAYSQIGDDRQAVSSLATAVELAPNSSPMRARYADALALVGEPERAIEQYRYAGLSPADAAERLVRQGAALEKQGEPTRVRRHLEAALEISPACEHASVPLVRFYITTGSLDSARVVLARAGAAGLDVNMVRAHAAWICAAAGDRAGAQRLLDSIPPEIRAGDPRVVATLSAIEQSERK